jgi:hypothetical protein
MGAYMPSSFDRPTVLDDLKAAEKLTKSAFTVYRTLERMAVAHGNGFRAKHETIAIQAGVSISTVQRALRELLACQMVRMRANARTIAGRNYRISNSYFIMRAAVWCFSERLKQLAKVVRRVIHRPAFRPVSVKTDRANRTNASIGLGMVESRLVTVDDLSRLANILNRPRKYRL